MTLAGGVEGLSCLLYAQTQQAAAENGLYFVEKGRPGGTGLGNKKKEARRSDFARDSARLDCVTKILVHGIFQLILSF